MAKLLGVAKVKAFTFDILLYKSYRHMRIFSIVGFLLGIIALQAQNALYFPPNIGNMWETIPPSDLGFCPERIDSLYRFLGDQDTKGFLLLKDGKIVLEKYYGSFTQDSAWYWASAGKSLTAYLAGIAADENNLDINASAQTYLGSAWSSAPPDKEALIKVRHLLTMSSGLNDAPVVPGVTDPANCIDPACFQYVADAGTRWAYHNAAYFLVQDIIEESSGKTINQFTKTRLFDRIGAKGLWLDHVMYSTTRSMARFGLLALAKGVWSGDTIIHDPTYVQAMSQTSQQLNQSYGYLWWLNGKSTFMLPTIQLVLPGPLIPNAPSDMFAALGKNDQKIHVVPSKGWVVIRMGNASSVQSGPAGGTVPISFDNKMWDYINALNCTTALEEIPISMSMIASPNPSQDIWHIEFNETTKSEWKLFDALGRVVKHGYKNGNSLEMDSNGLPCGVYTFLYGNSFIKLVKG